MKILFNYGENPLHIEGDKRGYSGVGYYRTVKVSQQIKGHDVTLLGHDVKQYGKTYEEKWDNIFKEFDVYWTSYHCDAQEASAMYYFRDLHNKKVIIDIDDNYLDVLQTNPLFDNLSAGKKDKSFIGAMLSMADVVTCSTEPLAQRLDEHFKTVYGLDKKIVVLPNFNDEKDWSFPLAPKHKDKIVIGYAGSNSHHDDLVMFLPHLAKIMDKYKNVHFESMGMISKDKINLFDGFSEDAVTRCDLLPSCLFREYPERMANNQWDIAVAPLVDSAFTRCKSHIKWMENAILKIPIIASKTYPYYVDLWGRQTIKDGETGLLVKPSEWYDAMESLILSKEKRETIGENAQRAVKNNWQYSNSNMEKVIDEMLRNINTQSF